MVDAPAFTDWMAFYDLEPWGERRDDYRIAILCQAMCASRGQSCKFEDFMPKLENAKYYLNEFDKPATPHDELAECKRQLGRMAAMGCTARPVKRE